MKDIAKVAALSVVAWAFIAVSTPATAATKVVAIKAGEIYVSDGSNPFVQTTKDGKQKALPVWSKDGAHIAFIEYEPSGQQHLRVINSSGSPIYDALIQSDKYSEVGMRFESEVAWLSADKIVVAGSVNPSTTEYKVFSLKSRQPILDFFDEGVGAAFSPDGRHYAYLTGRPHFTPARNQIPQLIVDGIIIPAKLQATWSFNSLVWSENSKSLAVGALDERQSEARMIVWSEAGDVKSLSLRIDLQSRDMQLFWNDDNLYAELMPPDGTSGRVEAWQVIPDEGTFRQVSSVAEGGILRPKIVNPSSEVDALVSSFQKRAAYFGGRDLNFWCNDCRLNAVPEKATR